MPNVSDEQQFLFFSCTGKSEIFDSSSVSAQGINTACSSESVREIVSKEIITNLK